MGKEVPRTPDAHISPAKSISFSKDDETGLFRKSVQGYTANHLEHTTKKSGKPSVDEELYELSTSDDYEYMFEVTGPGGKDYKLYFKKHTKV